MIIISSNEAIHIIMIELHLGSSFDLILYFIASFFRYNVYNVEFQSVGIESFAYSFQNEKHSESGKTIQKENRYCTYLFEV